MKRFLMPLILCLFVALVAAGCGNHYAAKQQSPHYAEAVALGRASADAAAMPAQSASPLDAQKNDPTRHEQFTDNPVKQVAREPLTTFSLDVDTASYAFARSFIKGGQYPPTAAVRTEEMLNYFPSTPEDARLTPIKGSPFSSRVELAPSPWDKDKTLMSLTVEASTPGSADVPPANLVFLVDTSGSMYGADRLDLVKKSLVLLLDHLRPSDRISVVTYAGSTHVALETTAVSNKAEIIRRIENLEAGGSTAGAAGLELAYQQAETSFIKGGINRILLCTDGDFNVGLSSSDALKEMVARKREGGITLSTLGFGMGNFNDSMMVAVADIGNGNYSYIDSLQEAKKVLGEEMRATLVTVAKDVKAQIEFNPALVKEYRQIGYEKRQLANEDFTNDAVDAGDVGAGKRVTVLYELTLAGQPARVDALRYGHEGGSAARAEAAEGQRRPKGAGAQELAFIKLRWKQPDGTQSTLATQAVSTKQLAPSFAAASPSFRFFAAVAAFGQKLRQSPYLAGTTWADIAAWGQDAKGSDPQGYRGEFVQLVNLLGAFAEKGKMQ